MPNWVFNEVEITGDAESIANLKAQVGASYSKDFVDNEWNADNNEWVKKLKTVDFSNPVFSFWNIKKPEDAIMETYVGLVDDKVKIEDLSIMDKIMLDMSTSNGWYEWNCRNWGTKWDVAVNDNDVYPDTSLEKETATSLAYRFNTAWGSPLEAITELAKQYPSLTITINYEEEQGWGGSAVFQGGEVIDSNEYDVPSSHAEIVERGNECYCTGLEEDKVFSDCPVNLTSETA